MYTLIVAATDGEIMPTVHWLRENHYRAGKNDYKVLVTGVGAIPTTAALYRCIYDERPDFMIQAGIAGCFDKEKSLGSVFAVEEELLADTGVEENGEWKDIFDMGLTAPDQYPFHRKVLKNPQVENHSIGLCPVARAVTINTITTRGEKISQIGTKYSPLVESMEGAAFHFCALSEHIPFLQVRSISNYAGERDKRNWKLKEAIENLNHVLIKMLREPGPHERVSDII